MALYSGSVEVSWKLPDGKTDWAVTDVLVRARSFDRALDKMLDIGMHTVEYRVYKDKPGTEVSVEHVHKVAK